MARVEPALSKSKSSKGSAAVRRHFRRLLAYVLQERRLLVLSVVFGVLGLCLPFAYPLIIGAAIDHVIAPQPIGGALPTHAERVQWLNGLTLAAAIVAIAFGLVGYAKGHYTVLLGNRIVTRLRADLFEHFQKLSLQFYAKERTGGIVWRIAHEVNGVSGLLYAGVLLLGFDLVQFALAITLLVSISWPLALAVLSIMPLYLWVFRRYNPQVQAASEAVGRHISTISGTMHEQISAVALVKTYTAEEQEAARFLTNNDRHHAVLSQQSHLGHLMGASGDLLVHQIGRAHV